MVTEMISLKLDTKFLEDIDTVVENEHYQNRTEFIRAALREKVDEIKLKEVMDKLSHLRGASGKKTTDEELERIKDMAAKKLFKEAR